jgi:hypothetical protein
MDRFRRFAPATAHQFFEDALGILDCVSDGEQ